MNQMRCPKTFLKRGYHKWENCKCIKCGLIKHDWLNCKCNKCGITYTGLVHYMHKWDGCVCSICGTTRKYDQDWKISREDLHKWTNCACEKCGEPNLNSMRHEWQALKCAKCNISIHTYIVSNHDSQNINLGLKHLFAYVETALDLLNILTSESNVYLNDFTDCLGNLKDPRIKIIDEMVRRMKVECCEQTDPHPIIKSTCAIIVSYASKNYSVKKNSRFFNEQQLHKTILVRAGNKLAYSEVKKYSESNGIWDDGRSAFRTILQDLINSNIA